MTVWIACLNLLFSFFKIGLFGFGGGYAMMSMIMTESMGFGVTVQQLADLNALDMVVPGPIAINAATYVGYLAGGFWGAFAGTLGVMLPSFILIALVMRFLNAYKQNRIMSGFLSGVKPGAVGLIAAAALTIAVGILFVPGTTWQTFWADPFHSFSFLLTGVFIITAVLNIRFRVNPILLTVIAGIVGAIWLR